MPRSAVIYMTIGMNLQMRLLYKENDDAMTTRLRNFHMAGVQINQKSSVVQWATKKSFLVTHTKIPLVLFILLYSRVDTLSTYLHQI